MLRYFMCTSELWKKKNKIEKRSVQTQMQSWCADFFREKMNFRYLWKNLNETVLKFQIFDDS